MHTCNSRIFSHQTKQNYYGYSSPGEVHLYPLYSLATPMTVHGKCVVNTGILERF